MQSTGDGPLAPADRLKAQVMADYMLETIERRYGITIQDIVAAVQDHKARQERQRRIEQGGALAVLGLILSGIAMLLIEGFKYWLRHPR